MRNFPIMLWVLQSVESCSDAPISSGYCCLRVHDVRASQPRTQPAHVVQPSILAQWHLCTQKLGIVVFKWNPVRKKWRIEWFVSHLRQRNAKLEVSCLTGGSRGCFMGPTMWKIWVFFRPRNVFFLFFAYCAGFLNWAAPLNIMKKWISREATLLSIKQTLKYLSVPHKWKPTSTFLNIRTLFHRKRVLNAFHIFSQERFISFQRHLLAWRHLLWPANRCWTLDQLINRDHTQPNRSSHSQHKTWWNM